MKNCIIYTFSGLVKKKNVRGLESTQIFLSVRMLEVFCLSTYFHHSITTVSEHFTTALKYHYSSCVKYECIYPLSTGGKLRHEDV